METKIYTSTIEESTIVERVARIVSSVRGTKPDYTRLAAELEQAIPFDVFGVVLLRHDRQAVRVTVCHREAGTWAAFQHQHPYKDSKLEHVLCTPTLMSQEHPNGLDGPPAISGDALSGYHQLRSTLIAPLVVEDRVLGTLELGSHVSHAYADKTLQRLISAVVRVLAAAIEGAQVGGNVQIQDRQRQALKDVSCALTSKMDLSTILNQIVVGIASALDVASAVILINRRKRCLSLVAQSRLDLVALERIFNQDMRVTAQSILGQTLQRRQPYASYDIANDERFPDSHNFASELGMHSVFSYPLVIGSTIYGALLLFSSEPGGFTPLKADILSLFASQATVAIHNGLLLESAHQRSRFQEAIEQLEKAHLHTSSDIAKSDEGSAKETEEEALSEEQKLLVHVREEAKRTFGVSFTSLLRFLSEHLLVRSERELQAILSEDQGEQALDPFGFVLENALESTTTGENALLSVTEIQSQGYQKPLTDTLSLLTQTAEAALARASMLGELSHLLMQLKQSTNGAREKDAWCIVALDGICLYMNPVAESLCEVRLEEITSAHGAQLLTAAQGQNSSLIREGIFARLLPRIRNADEVQQYLSEFTRGNVSRQELRCVLAREPLQTQDALPKMTNRRNSLSLENASSDDCYQLIRYPLYNRQGQLTANALQMSDITEQVRDEKNRSALLSSVSHDLRTPLTTIKAAVTGLLQEDVAWSEQDRREMLEDIDAETDHLTILVNALVEMSRIEMGALVLEKEWCDVVEVVYGTLAKLARALAGHPVRIHVPFRLPLVYVDHVQVERVCYNLIENAVRHSPEQAEIVVTLDVVENMLRVQVLDHGCGIPEGERERVLKSFYGLHSYGNELGLAICKGIIEAHQGRIWVEAVSDGGSCFIFMLPVHPHAGVSAPSIAGAATTSSPKIHAVSGQSVHEARGEELL